MKRSRAFRHTDDLTNDNEPPRGRMCKSGRSVVKRGCDGLHSAISTNCERNTNIVVISLCLHIIVNSLAAPVAVHAHRKIKKARSFVGRSRSWNTIAESCGVPTGAKVARSSQHGPSW